ncbi:hemerythrin domain-containing protein [Oxalobacteraceae bacterium CAVE-383]|nr:hemerythrin domain-containing protein [Oxalobacteraceae bacterium CAVE-383]
MFSLKKLSPTITDMIRFDHSHALLTFHQYKAATRPTVKKALAETVCTALEIHATLEEEIFYPAVRLLNPEEEVIRKSVPEHDEMRRIIAELRITDPKEVRHDELMHDLMRDVMHHVADEESVLLPEAENMLPAERLSELGADMASRRMALMAPKTGSIVANTAIGFSGSTTAIVMGIAGALLAAKAFSKKSADKTA